MTAFKKYEAWWDEEEQNHKMRETNVPVEAEKENKDKPEVKEEKKNITTESLLSSILDSNFDSVNYNTSSGGFGLGFRAALPKMPSFRVSFKKIIKRSLYTITIFFPIQVNDLMYFKILLTLLVIYFFNRVKITFFINLLLSFHL